jgi:hypothetical protein
MHKIFLEVFWAPKYLSKKKNTRMRRLSDTVGGACRLRYSFLFSASNAGKKLEKVVLILWLKYVGVVAD